MSFEAQLFCQLEMWGFFNRSWSCNEFVTQFPAFVGGTVKSAETDYFLSDGAWASRGAVFWKATKDRIIHVHIPLLHITVVSILVSWYGINSVINIINHTVKEFKPSVKPCIKHAQTHALLRYLLVLRVYVGNDYQLLPCKVLA